MIITTLEKRTDYETNKVTFKVEIEINDADKNFFWDHQGYDMIPDDLIPDILVAVGRMYKGKIKDGRILKEKVGSII
jgi:hypothetical protein